MKQIEINPSNKPYYSKEFVDGFECGTKTQFDADKEVIRRIKEAREKIIQLELIGYATVDGKRTIAGKAVFQIIDKLIAEVEG